MTRSKSAISILSNFRSIQGGKISAYLLLFLLSISFALEHQIFFENDVIELVESSEKESDPKEKKLLFQTDISICAYADSNNLTFFLWSKEIMPSSIYLERQTPPPKYT